MSETLTVVLFACVFFGLLAHAIRREQKRQEEWRALASKYNLLLAPSRPITRYPNLRAFIFKAAYSNTIEGRIPGSAISAFDFTRGFGRNRRLGSAAGIRSGNLAVKPPTRSRRHLPG